MYKLLVRNANLPKNTYSFYTVTEIEHDDEAETCKKVTKVWQTSSVESLAEKYQELLATYNTDSIKAIQDLDVEMDVIIDD